MRSCGPDIPEGSEGPAGGVLEGVTIEAAEDPSVVDRESQDGRPGVPVDHGCQEEGQHVLGYGPEQDEEAPHRGGQGLPRRPLGTVLSRVGHCGGEGPGSQRAQDPAQAAGQDDGGHGNPECGEGGCAASLFPDARDPGPEEPEGESLLEHGVRNGLPCQEAMEVGPASLAEDVTGLNLTGQPGPEHQSTQGHTGP